jgi:hypothetical protein
MQIIIHVIKEDYRGLLRTVELNSFSKLLQQRESPQGYPLNNKNAVNVAMAPPTAMHVNYSPGE